MPFEKSSAALIELVQKIGDRTPEPNYAAGVVAPEFILAPGKITVIGAPPGTGKTALASQIVFESLIENPDLRLWIANCEMDIQSLLRREIARQSGVSHRRIRDATFDDTEHRRILDAAERLLPVSVRIRHMVPPFTPAELAQLVMESQPGILVVDYLQKFRAADRDARAGVDEVISVLRGLAFHGWAVLAMSSTTRQQGAKKGGHDHAGLSMSSFKESGEIEFNADAAYLLRDTTDGASGVRSITLDCVKNRNGERQPIDLRFCGDYMRFERVEPATHSEFDEFATAGAF